MSNNIRNYKIRVRCAEVEIEVIGKTAETTKNTFDELAKKYFKKDITHRKE